VSGGGAAPPPGYVRGRRGVAELVARADVAAAIETALATSGTLYDYAARHPAARAFQGRAPAYAAPLPGGGLPVVVRHSWHGGLLAPLTGDRFLRPTRAGAELAAAVRLAESGVPTPELVAYVLYPAGPLLGRADVATREVPAARDLGDVLAARGAPAGWLPALLALLDGLARAGARHPDLNVKNVLLAGPPNGGHGRLRARRGPGAVRRAGRPSHRRGERGSRAPVRAQAVRARARARRRRGARAARGTSAPPPGECRVTRPSPALTPGARICIVMLSAVGDSVFVLPVVTALKRHDPTCRITWLLEPGPAALVAGHPAVDEIVGSRPHAAWRASSRSAVRWPDAASIW
jgi:hypothetical protein